MEGKNGENAMPRGGRVPPVISEQRWLSYADLAGRFGVCERTIRRDVDEGKLPKPDRFRRCVRFDWLKVDAALKARKET